MRQRTAKLVRRVARLGGTDPRMALRDFKKDFKREFSLGASHKVRGEVTRSLLRMESQLLEEIKQRSEAGK